MATFLQLVNEVERESGTISQSQRLITVVSPTGRQEKVVQWVRQAWEDIQRSRRDWTFRRLAFSHALTIGQSTYTAAQMGLTSFGGWLTAQDGYWPFTLYDTALGRTSESRLEEVSYAAWLAQYDLATTTSTRPLHVAFGWDRSLNLGPPPDAAYTLRGWYKRGIQSLALDADEPYISEEFHKPAIVARALMLLAEHDEAQQALGQAQGEYRLAYSALVREYTQGIEV